MFVSCVIFCRYTCMLLSCVISCRYKSMFVSCVMCCRYTYKLASCVICCRFTSMFVSLLFAAATHLCLCPFVHPWVSGHLCVCVSCTSLCVHAQTYTFASDKKLQTTWWRRPNAWSSGFKHWSNKNTNGKNKISLFELESLPMLESSLFFHLLLLLSIPIWKRFRFQS